MAEFSAWEAELTALTTDVCVAGRDVVDRAWPMSGVGTSDAGSLGEAAAGLEAAGAPAHAPDSVEIVRHSTIANTANRPVFKRKLALKVDSHVKHT